MKSYIMSLLFKYIYVRLIIKYCITVLYLVMQHAGNRIIIKLILFLYNYIKYITLETGTFLFLY
jgi:hypothetical protein